MMVGVYVGEGLVVFLLVVWFCGMMVGLVFKGLGRFWVEGREEVELIEGSVLCRNFLCSGLGGKYYGLVSE